MKEKLVAYLEQQERYIERMKNNKKVFFDQSFGAVSFAIAMAKDIDEEAELAALWNNEWRKRLEAKVYGC